MRLRFRCVAVDCRQRLVVRPRVADRGRKIVVACPSCGTRLRSRIPEDEREERRAALDFFESVGKLLEDLDLDPGTF